MTILKYLIITIIIIFILIWFFYNLREYRYNKKHKEILGNLTGDFYYRKTPKGIEIMVMYRTKDDVLKRRVATKSDIERLKKVKYI